MSEQPDAPTGSKGEPAPEVQENTPTSSPEESAAAGGQNDSPPVQGEGEQDSW
jgi:hypothetical protein